MPLAPALLAAFSPYARDVLAAAHRDRVPVRRDVLTRRLRVEGLPPCNAWLAFQARYGGLRFRIGGKREGCTFAFGLDPARHLRDPDAPRRHAVLIGRGVDDLYMDARGEVLVEHDGVIMRNSSIESYLEQAIDAPRRVWRGPQFGATIDTPALAEAIATKFGAAIDAPRSDAYQSLWASPRLRIWRTHYPRSWRSKTLIVRSRSLPLLVAMLEEVQRCAPTARFRVSGSPVKHVRPTRRARAAVPSCEAWADHARLRLEGPDTSVVGPVWVVGDGETLALHNHSFEVFGDGPRTLIEWSTITKSGELCRDLQ